jgi:hypothetical protein
MHEIIDKKFYLGPKFGTLFNKKWVTISELLQCGLRQGDPLSPLLFDLVMDVLHLMIEKAVDDGLITDLATSGFRHRTSMSPSSGPP